MIQSTIIPILSVILSSLVAYQIATKVSEAEHERAKSVLSSICLRFFMNVWNSLEATEKKGSFEVKKDQLSKIQYVTELSSILDALSSLSANPLFTRLIRDVPSFPPLVVRVRRELIEHQHSSSFLLNQNSISDFIALFEWLEEEGYAPAGNIWDECRLFVEKIRHLKTVESSVGGAV